MYWVDDRTVVPDTLVTLIDVLPPNAVSMAVKFAFTGTSHVPTYELLAGVVKFLFVVIL